jgi:nucleoside-diphosphate-sugar epimerase
MLHSMHLLILGCGSLGELVGARMVAQGHRVTGIRRTPGTVPNGLTLRWGDAADPAVHAGITEVDAVLLAANPGIRRGRDNGLVELARVAGVRYPHARLIYTGTTSVYGDAAGGAVGEDGPLAADAESQALLAIEAAVAALPQSLILRATAIVGPSRNFARERLSQAVAGRSVGELVVKGDPERPFSYVHEYDLAEVCTHAVVHGLGRGIVRLLNVAAPDVLTVRDYYGLLARELGVTVTIRGDGSAVPSRAIFARKLYSLLPGHAWRGVLTRE